MKAFVFHGPRKLALEIAKKFAATKVINNCDGTVIEKVMALTGTQLFLSLEFCDKGLSATDDRWKEFQRMLAQA
jgi:hypothetical protein